MGDDTVVSEQFIQGRGLQSGVFAEVERDKVQTEYLYLAYQAPQRVVGGVDTTVVAQALNNQGQVVQQSAAVTIRITVQASPDEIHLLAIDFPRITRLQSAVAVRSHGYQQFRGDAHFFGRLRQMVAQASDIMQIDL